MSHRTVVLLAAVVAAAAAPAFAADAPADYGTSVVAPAEGIGQADWRVTIKATGVIQPEFEGAKDYAISGYPGLSIRRPGQPWKFGAPDDGFGFAIIDTDLFQIGPVARLRSERDSSDERKIRGLSNIDWAVEPGLFVEFYPTTKTRIRAEVRHGIGGHDGFVGDIAADWIERFDRFTVSFGPRLALGDSDFMNEYYGVSARESARNGRLDAYKADGGVKSVGVAGAVTYDWTPNWSTTAFGAYNRLTGDAKDSPIVKRLDSKDNFTFGLGAAYSFDW
ncbi:MipA/OmpV family protein [Methylopila henanensis]|uniref:MipA/OmpV family protein n=1 Tax=Methylopila henanensis TaxID=873516 RepID=A0ABW4K6I7_9HYPH